MELDRHEDDRPLWLDIALQPGVIDVLVALFNRGGPLTFHELGQIVPDKPPNVAERAVSRLGACGLVQRTSTRGSWDQPELSAQFELTDRGHRYTETIDELTRWAKRLPATRGTTRTLTPRSVFGKNRNPRARPAERAPGESG